MVTTLLAAAALLGSSPSTCPATVVRYQPTKHPGLGEKVLWQVTRNWGGSLRLLGTRLDTEGTFRQEFPMAYSPESYFPSIVDVPAQGCWSFTLRTAQLAGVLVVRAVDAPG